jgi:hypothetical protein
MREGNATLYSSILVCPPVSMQCLRLDWFHWRALRLELKS